MNTEEEKTLLNKMNSSAFSAKLGDLVGNKPNIVRASYDFAGMGGAVGQLNLLKDPSGLDVLDNRLVLPDNAIIKHAYVDILTAMASGGGAGTVALDSEGAGDLLAAVDADTLAGLVAGIPDNAVANMIKLTAERTLAMTIAVEALTAGKFDLYVEWIRGN